MIFDSYSGVYCLKSEQILDVSIDDAWKFFSDPENLNVITPPDLSFEITSNDSQSIYSGKIITYRIGIFPLIRSNWVTEITQVKEKEYFIDEQRFGPYSFWHHVHYFTDLDGKTLMNDIIHFKIPFGVVGRLFFPLLVKPRLQKIFTYRQVELDKLFGKV